MLDLATILKRKVSQAESAENGNQMAGNGSQVPKPKSFRGHPANANLDYRYFSVPINTGGYLPIPPNTCLDYPSSPRFPLTSLKPPGFLLMPAHPSRSYHKFSAPNRHLGAYRSKISASRHQMVTVPGWWKVHRARICDSNPRHVSTNTSTYSYVLLLIYLRQLSYPTIQDLSFH